MASGGRLLAAHTINVTCAAMTGGRLSARYFPVFFSFSVFHMRTHAHTLSLSRCFWRRDGLHGASGRLLARYLPVFLCFFVLHTLPRRSVLQGPAHARPVGPGGRGVAMTSPMWPGWLHAAAMGLNGIPEMAELQRLGPFGVAPVALTRSAIASACLSTACTVADWFTFTRSAAGPAAGPAAGRPQQGSALPPWRQSSTSHQLQVHMCQQPTQGHCPQQQHAQQQPQWQHQFAGAEGRAQSAAVSGGALAAEQGDQQEQPASPAANENEQAAQQQQPQWQHKFPGAAGCAEGAAAVSCGALAAQQGHQQQQPASLADEKATQQQAQGQRQFPGAAGRAEGPAAASCGALAAQQGQQPEQLASLAANEKAGEGQGEDRGCRAAAQQQQPRSETTAGRQAAIKEKQEPGACAATAATAAAQQKQQQWHQAEEAGCGGEEPRPTAQQCKQEKELPIPTGRPMALHPPDMEPAPAPPVPSKGKSSRAGSAGAREGPAATAATTGCQNEACAGQDSDCSSTASVRTPAVRTRGQRGGVKHKLGWEAKRQLETERKRLRAASAASEIEAERQRLRAALHEPVYAAGCYRPARSA